MADPFVGEIRAVAFPFVPTGWALCNGQQLQISQYQALFALLSNKYGGDGIANFCVPDLQGRNIVGFGDGYNLPAATWPAKIGAASTTLSVDQMPAHSHTAVVTDPGHTHSSSLPAHTHSFAQQCDDGTGGGPQLPSPVNAYPCVSIGVDASVNTISNYLDDPTNSTGLSGVPTVSGTPLYSKSGPLTMAGGTTGLPSAAASSPTGTAHAGISVINSISGGSGSAQAEVATQSPGLVLYYIIALMGIFPQRC